MRQANKLSLVFLLVFTACAIGAAKTADQRFYAVKATYRDALTAVTEYADNCAKKPVKNGCDKNVDRLREIDTEVYDSIESADKLRQSGLDADYAIAVGAAEKSMDRIFGFLSTIKEK